MSKIFETFVGEPIRVTLKKDDKGTVQDPRGNFKLIQSSFMIQGFLVDECDDYFYLAYNSDAELINIAILRSDVLTIELFDPNEEDAQLLDSAVDESDTGMN